MRKAPVCLPVPRTGGARARFVHTLAARVRGRPETGRHRLARPCALGLHRAGHRDQRAEGVGVRRRGCASDASARITASCSALQPRCSHGWCTPARRTTCSAVARNALVMCSVLGFWNLLYDVKALQAGVLRVYNQPWAEGQADAAVAMDYAPWFFGGFGAVYGAGLGDDGMACGAPSRSRRRCSPSAFSLTLALSLGLPTAGYILQSRRRYGHWGTRPVKKKCPSA